MMEQLGILLLHPEIHQEGTHAVIDFLHLAVAPLFAMLRIDQIHISMSKVAVGNHRVGVVAFPAGDHPGGFAVFDQDLAHLAIGFDLAADLQEHFFERFHHAYIPPGVNQTPPAFSR